MYKAIVFDLGNVLVMISQSRIFEYWSRVTGQRFEDIMAIKNRIGDGEEIRLEIGQITPAEFRRNVTAKIGLQISDSEFDQGWNNIFVGINSGIERVLMQLKPNYRLIGLSNTNSIHVAKWEREYPQLLEYFEKFFYSHQIGHRKPEPKAFQIILEFLKLPPSAIVFIDDNPMNVEGARRLGITGILMQSVAQLVRDLNELSIKVDFATGKEEIFHADIR